MTMYMAKEYLYSLFFWNRSLPSKRSIPVNASFFIGNIGRASPAPDNTFLFLKRLVFAALSSEVYLNLKFRRNIYVLSFYSFTRRDHEHVAIRVNMLYVVLDFYKIP